MPNVHYGSKLRNNGDQVVCNAIVANSNAVYSGWSRLGDPIRIRIRIGTLYIQYEMYRAERVLFILKTLLEFSCIFCKFVCIGRDPKLIANKGNVLS